MWCPERNSISAEAPCNSARDHELNIYSHTQPLARSQSIPADGLHYLTVPRGRNTASRAFRDFGHFSPKLQSFPHTSLLKFPTSKEVLSLSQNSKWSTFNFQEISNVFFTWVKVTVMCSIRVDIYEWKVAIIDTRIWNLATWESDTSHKILLEMDANVRHIIFVLFYFFCFVLVDNLKCVKDESVGHIVRGADTVGDPCWCTYWWTNSKWFQLVFGKSGARDVLP